MTDFLQENGVALVFGVLGFCTSVVAISYARKNYQLRRALPGEEGGRPLTVFWSREGMIRHLLAQYDAANPREEIWAQTVGLANYPGSVEEKVLKAAARGVVFKYIVGESNPDKESFVALFSSINSAQIAQSSGNRLRVQGLGDREVIVALATITTYTAIKVTDKEFVRAIKSWYDMRWAEAAANGLVKQRSE